MFYRALVLPMRLLVFLLFATCAGCAVSRGTTAEGQSYLNELSAITSVADSTEDVQAWARVASLAARPPSGMNRAEREEGCSVARRADSRLREMLYDTTDGLHIRGADVAFYVEGEYLANPDSTWKAAEHQLGCQRAAR